MTTPTHPSHPDQLVAAATGVCWHSPTSDRWPCHADTATTGTTAEEFERRGQAQAGALSGGLSATEVLAAALARYQRDPLAHMRAELAVRVVDTRAGQEACDPADYRTLIRAGAIVALELVTRAQARDELGLTPRERAELILAGTLAGAGAPAPVELTRNLLEALERDGLRITRRPA